MKAMKTNLLVFLTGAGLVGAITVHLWTKPPHMNALVADDPSPSMRRDCEALAEGSKHWLAAKPGIQDGSTLTLLIMGKDAANPEPTLALSEKIPIKDVSTIGSDPQEFEVAQGRLFGEIKEACNNAKPGRQSPIYQMVRQGLALLHGADGKGHGYILLRSDLDDDAHPALSAVLREAIRNPNVEVPAELARSLDNSNVSIDICGSAEQAPRKGRPATSFDTRLQIWKSLFTHPELLTVQPFCGVGAAQ